MTAAIEVEGLNKSFGGRRVVRDFSIEVEEGRITGFLGPNVVVFPEPLGPRKPQMRPSSTWIETSSTTRRPP